MHPQAASPQPMPTLFGILALAAPIMLSNATTPLIGFVDAAVIGRLGDAALIGGVAVAATIFSTLYWGVGFLRMSTTGFTAQALGAGDGREIAATLARALLVGAIIGLAIVLFQVPIRRAFLWTLGGSDAVQTAATDYYNWRIWAAPAGLINFTLLGWFIGLGRTMTAFWLQLIANLFNIAFAVLFVPVLSWGVPGVGLAAFLAETAATVAGLWLAWREAQARGATTDRASILTPAKLTAMFAANRDILIRTVCILAVTQIFIRFSAEGGDAVLAANAVLMSVLYITYYLLDGYAQAAETLVGQSVGARDRPRLDATVKLTAVAAGITGFVVSAIIWLAGPSIVAFMTTNTEVRAIAAQFLPWAAALPFIGVWCFLFDGVFIGATRTIDMRNMMLISFVIYLAALAAFLPWLGTHGLWAAHSTFFIARAVTLWWAYRWLADDVGARAPVPKRF
jgi:multidrug resistance protein, MATE family